MADKERWGRHGTVRAPVPMRDEDANACAVWRCGGIMDVATTVVCAAVQASLLVGSAPLVW